MAAGGALQVPMGMPMQAPVSPGASSVARKKNLQELVGELKGSSAVQLKLLEEIGVVRQHMTSNTGVATDAYNVLQKSLEPLMQDVLSKNHVINNLLIEIEDKNSAIKVLRNDLEEERRNVLAERAKAAGQAAALSQAAGDLSEPQMRHMPVEQLVGRVVEAQAAAFANYRTAEEAKQKLNDVTNELIRLKDAEQSMALLRRGVAEQSEYILKLQDAIKLHETRYGEAKEVAENQEQVIKSMEDVMDASALESAAQIVSSLRMKLLAAQRREDDAQRQLDSLKAQARSGQVGYDAQMQEVHAELGRMDVELFGSANGPLERLDSLQEFVQSQTEVEAERGRIIDDIHAIKAKCKAEWHRQLEATRKAEGELEKALRKTTQTEDAYVRICTKVTGFERAVKSIFEKVVSGGRPPAAGSPRSRASSRRSSPMSNGARDPLSRGASSRSGSRMKMLSSLHDPESLCDHLTDLLQQTLAQLHAGVDLRAHVETAEAGTATEAVALHQDANAGADDGVQAKIEGLQEQKAELEAKLAGARREVSALQSNVEVLHEQSKDREKKSAKEISGLKLRLLEAKVVAAISRGKRDTGTGASPAETVLKKAPRPALDPVAPKNRFEGGDPHGRAAGWKS
eukprot:TRINITY_DN6028_c0_g1_i1.p1 TRINITY_DN6028_c0_g1~~TRINITY_DN6028_c0_g1_i1.p1  ORF type:complete len:628 (+),score=242.57 TRINITY_DN6028_c0_g1_i1:123-2006(+)